LGTDFVIARQIPQQVKITLFINSIIRYFQVIILAQSINYLLPYVKVRTSVQNANAIIVKIRRTKSN